MNGMERMEDGRERGLCAEKRGWMEEKKTEKKKEEKGS